MTSQLLVGHSNCGALETRGDTCAVGSVYGWTVFKKSDRVWGFSDTEKTSSQSWSTYSAQVLQCIFLKLLSNKVLSLLLLINLLVYGKSLFQSIPQLTFFCTYIVTLGIWTWSRCSQSSWSSKCPRLAWCRCGYQGNI